ncbi:hypothetical protein VKT23_018411 [Stygiomarasmius scandens]|uniref:Uncharacterized protein n=1 Tax=Marasmiellus scandens TaxID=2682957 RepID=A0ABR1IP94_9AGAR
MSATSEIILRRTPTGNLNEMEQGRENSPNPSRILASGIDPSLAVSASAYASAPGSTSVRDRAPSVTVNNQPYVKITWWRFINTAVPATFGLWKIIGTYRGETTTPTTIDLVLSVFWYVFSYWMGIWETTHSPSIEWLFDIDIYESGQLQSIGAYFQIFLLFYVMAFSESQKT